LLALRGLKTLFLFCLTELKPAKGQGRVLIKQSSAFVGLSKRMIERIAVTTLRADPV